MIEVYREKTDSVIMDNDAAFVLTKLDCDDIEMKIVASIDKGDLVSPDYFIDRNGYKISVGFLSTGSKTLLNLYKNPDRIYFSGEMGDNAVRLLTIIPNCKIYVRDTESLEPVEDIIVIL